MTSLRLLPAVLLAFGPIAAVLGDAVTLKAMVSMGGVKGEVSLTQADASTDPTITFPTFVGPNQAKVAKWALYPRRVDFDRNEPCSTESLGTTTILAAADTSSTTATGKMLSGVDSIEGGSLVLLDATDKAIACATLESSEEYTTARAVFYGSDVLGSVTFRQLKGEQAAPTQVIVNLHKKSTAPQIASLKLKVTIGRNETVFNPENRAGTCSTTDHTLCAIGDLDTKHAAFQVGNTPRSALKREIDLNLPLSGDNKIVDQFLTLFDGTKLLASASIRSSPRIGVATFEDDRVRGKVTFTQLSPLDPVTTKVSLTGLRRLAGGYHIHEWPVPQRALSSQSLCSADNVGGHFNPFQVTYDDDTPDPGDGTEDAYEVGDLSKKYGMLNALEEYENEHKDWNLQLFGPNTVMGRSVVIHYNQAEENNPRWVCTNIVDTAPLTVARATLTFPIIGHVLFAQRKGEEEAETSIYVRLDYGDGTINTTKEHAWRIYPEPSGIDAVYTKRCADAGLSPVNDLGNMHGKLSVRKSNKLPYVNFFIDTDLRLNEVVGKSLVVFREKNSRDRLSCSTIVTIPARIATSDIGDLDIKQSGGIVRTPSTVYINMTQITNDVQIVTREEDDTMEKAGKPSVTIMTIGADNSGCKKAKKSGTYNPFNPTPPDNNATLDQFAVGDVSGKYDALTVIQGKSYEDTNLNLFGPRSVIGRAILVTSRGVIRACSKIVEKADGYNWILEAGAIFNDASHSGRITLTQVMDMSGGFTDTTVVVDIARTDGVQSKNVSWYIYKNPPSFIPSRGPSGHCISTGYRYNPFFVETTKQLYDECGPENQLRCELGDMVSKFGIYTLGSGPMVGSDVHLPIIGPFGVAGRSFVLHDENGAMTVCAPIRIRKVFPGGSFLMKVLPDFNTSFQVDVMKQKVETFMVNYTPTNAKPFKLVLEQIPYDGKINSSCTAVTLHFMGPGGYHARNFLVERMDTQSFKTTMGYYIDNSGKCGVATAVVSLLLLSLCIILTQVIS